MTVEPWPKQGPFTQHHLKPIKRPCDFGLEVAVMNLETQLGSVEAYNRLVVVADQLRGKIANGKGEAQNPLYAIDVKGGTPIKSDAS